MSVEAEDILAEELVLGNLDPKVKLNWDSSISDMQIVKKCEDEKSTIIYFVLNA